MQLRPVTPADRHLLYPLLRASLHQDPYHDALWFEKIWGDHRFCQALAQVVVDNQQILGFVMAVVQDQSRQQGVLKILAVDPAQQRHGLGTLLLSSIQEQARNLNMKTLSLAGSPPNYLWPGLDAHYAGALAFFEKNKFKRTGEAVNLHVALASAPLDYQPIENRLAERGIHLRRAQTHDQPTLNAFLKANQWPNWRAEVNRTFQHQTISLHLAFNATELVGFAAYDCNNLGTGWFGPMGTHPETRGTGVGSALLKRCLCDIKQQGHAQATIAWAAALPFYKKAVDAYPARHFLCMEQSL